MQHKPPQGYSSPVQVQLDEINNLLKHCSDVQQCEISKLTIVIAGRNGREAVNKVLAFPPGNIPAEAKTFFQLYAERLERDKLALLNSQVMLRIGSSQVVLLEDFILDYTAGEIPALQADDAATVRNLEPGQIVTIQLNETPFQVQRIN